MPRRSPVLGISRQPFLEFSCFFKGDVGPCGHALTLTPIPGATKAGPLPSGKVLVPSHHRYYEPLGLPPRTVTLRHPLIATAFARRGPPGRVSPGPHQAFATCPLPYPEGVLRISGPSHPAVCCLRRDMIGSATLPFGTYLTRRQRFTHVGPAALLPLSGPYRPSRLLTLRSSGRISPDARSLLHGAPGVLTVAGLAPAGLVQHRDPGRGPRSGRDTGRV